MSPIRGISKTGQPQGDEEGVVLAITQFLQLNGAKVHRVVERIPWGKRTSEAGIPDLFGWWPRGHYQSKLQENLYGPGPLHFHIEVKKPGKKPTPVQMEWMKTAAVDGVVVLWADSVEMMVLEFRRSYGIVLRGL